MKRFFSTVLISCLVMLLPMTGFAQWNAEQNKWIVGDNDAVFYAGSSCTGTPWLMMQGVSEHPILHNVSSNGVRSWNNLIQCAELGKNAVATICSVQNYKGNCLELTSGVHSLTGTRLWKEVSSIRKTQ